MKDYTYFVECYTYFAEYYTCFAVVELRMKAVVRTLVFVVVAHRKVDLHTEIVVV